MVALEMEREGGRGEWGFKALKQSVKMLFTLGRHEVGRERGGEGGRKGERDGGMEGWREGEHEEAEAPTVPPASLTHSLPTSLPFKTTGDAQVLRLPSR